MDQHFLEYPKAVQGASGIAVIEAIPLYGEANIVFVVYFRGHKKGFGSEASANAFAKFVADNGWDDEWSEEADFKP